MDFYTYAFETFQYIQIHRLQSESFKLVFYILTTSFYYLSEY